MPEYIKEGDHALKVVETKQVETVHDYKRLLAEKDRLVNQKDRFNTVIDAKIAKVALLISEADKLGVVAQAADAVVNP